MILGTVLHSALKEEIEKGLKLRLKTRPSNKAVFRPAHFYSSFGAFHGTNDSWRHPAGDLFFLMFMWFVTGIPFILYIFINYTKRNLIVLFLLKYYEPVQSQHVCS